MRFIEITPQQTNTNPTPKPNPHEGESDSPPDTHAGLMLATTIHESNTTPHHQAGQQHDHPQRWPHPDPTNGARRPRACCLRTQQCVWQIILDRRFPTPISCSSRLHQNRTHYRQRSIHESSRTPNSHGRGRGRNHVVLLRKEVIQPHLPVRLPCYDFVPIADPTFDGSLPRGVRPPASGVTDFHDVTGGVYKARERIHRSVADLRLLATPTSRGRVADPDPN